MAEHYTKDTLEALCWCNVCQRPTFHRVDDGRRGPCLEHEAPIKPKLPPVPSSGNLFPS